MKAGWSTPEPSVTAWETSWILDSDPAYSVGDTENIVKSNPKPLDPVDDKDDLEDPKKPTG